MLIIPAERKLDWRDPPLITLLLIIINCAIFFGYQTDDQDIYPELMKTYEEMQLSDRETPLYSDYLSQHKPEVWASIPLNSEEGSMILSMQLMHDLEFEKNLREHPDFDDSQWEKDRIKFEELRNQLSYVKYGFNPATPSLIDAFVSMFLHGDFGHLLGNMIFLFIFGCALEVVMGRLAYLGTYLLTGFAATGLYWIMQWSEHGFGVGASGAIAGLMGAYLGAYQTRKIQFFYWIGPYFNFIKAPALIIFPFWLGKEVIGQVFSNTNVNYWAHMGGLISGVIITLAARPWLNLSETKLEENSEQPVFDPVQAIDDLTNQLQHDKAIQLAEKLMQEHPGNVEILERLYALKQRNRNKSYHQLVLTIIKLPRTTETDALVASITNSYCKTPTLLKSGKLSAFWINRLIKADYFPQAFILAQKALSTTQETELLAPCLEALASYFRGKNDQHYQTLIKQLSSMTETQ
ncbi:rhomboid family intramembrane serine protease [Endozoicomonas arenosclerae]|uniref:rhomboid family intramembrane serine protease n=1 Tax=Endozoicomonas arenosclerae TaxID=1633495 RepID=UPI000781EDCF|nr:rhomboid family intramembrane serine protease [Endozoicomonas arenosclerae]